MATEEELKEARLVVLMATKGSNFSPIWSMYCIAVKSVFSAVWDTTYINWSVNSKTERTWQEKRLEEYIDGKIE